MSYTPESWNVEKLYSYGCEVGPYIMAERTPDGKRRIIAKVAGSPYLEDDGGKNIYAIAYLMAASPALLAAWVAFLASADAPPEQFDPAAQMAAIAAGRAAVAEALEGPKP